MASPVASPRLDSHARDLSRELKQGWEAKCRHDGRIYYANHVTKTTHWLPPVENWTCSLGLPYGWEMAVDATETQSYYLNHVVHLSTRKDPRKDEFVVGGKSGLREVWLERSPDLGFGFIAGSEKPVIIRSVLPGGPAEGKLETNDSIIRINGEDVEFASNPDVISAIKECEGSVCFVVRSSKAASGYKRTRKSSLVSGQRKSRKTSEGNLKVRFADPIANSITATSFGPQNSPVSKDVFRVHLENGQIRSVRFNSTTTVQQVIRRECDRLSIPCPQHFSLMMDGPGSVNLLYLPNHQLIGEINNLRSHCWKCRLRLRLITKESTDLLKRAPNAIDYLFEQTCNDVIAGRFGSDLTTDIAIKLGALHMQQHAAKTGPRNKISIKNIEKDVGLQKFLPEHVLLVMKPKELRKMISHCVKLNQLMSLPGERHLTDIQAKLLYLKIAAELRTFGGRYYAATYEKEQSEVTLLVSPRVGFCHMLSKQRNLLSTFADFDDVTEITLEEVDSRQSRILVEIKGNETVSFILDSNSAVDLAHLIDGYRTLFTDNRPLLKTSQTTTDDPDDTVASYFSLHTVVPSQWSYIPSIKSSDGIPTDWTSKRRLDLRRPSLPLFDQSRASPITVHLRKTGINLSDNDCYSSSTNDRASAHRRMMPPARRRSNSVDADDVMESAAAEAAAREAAKKAAKALRRSSFAYSPPPSPHLLEEFERTTKGASAVDDVELPEPLSVSSVFGDETISMEEDDDNSLHSLIETLNRRRESTSNDEATIVVAAAAESSSVRDSWSQIELTSDLRPSSDEDDDDDSVPPPPSEFSDSVASNGTDPLPTVDEVDENEDEDGENNETIVIPPPPGFGWDPSEDDTREPDVILPPPVAFSESESESFIHPEVETPPPSPPSPPPPPPSSSSRESVARESILVLDQVPSWLQEELRSSSESPSSAEDMDFIPPPPMDDYFSSPPPPIPPLPSHWAETEYFLDIPPPILEEPEDVEFSPEPPDDFKNNVAVPSSSPPPPLPSTPIPDEEQRRGKNAEEKREERRYPEPTIVPVSERTAQVLKKTPSSSLLVGVTTVKTSERRMPPPSNPRPRSAATSSTLTEKGKESTRSKSATLSKLSSLSKLMPKSPKKSRGEETDSPMHHRLHSSTKRPSPKSYKAPPPPSSPRSVLTSSPKPSPKLHRAPQPPTSRSPAFSESSSPNPASPLSAVTKSAIPVMHPRPWLPPSPGESKHSPSSPSRASLSSSPHSPARNRAKGASNSPSTKRDRVPVLVSEEGGGGGSPSLPATPPPPLPNIPPPPLPESSPPLLETETSPRRAAIREACTEGIMKLSGIVLELDTVLQCVLTKKLVDTDTKGYAQTKSALWTNAKELTQETKTLVTAVVQKHATAASVIATTLETVRRIADDARECVTSMSAIKNDFQPPDVRQSLIVAVMEVANAFRHVLASAEDAVASQMSESALMALMDSAKGIATIMSAFTRTLNEVETTMAGALIV